MNWHTKDILKEAKNCINDEGVFSPDQIGKLQDFLDLIAKAIDHEVSCISLSINHTM